MSLFLFVLFVCQTEVMMPQILIGRMPELYSEPDQFIPERWNKENKDTLPSMFAQLPFGFGARMCVGELCTACSFLTVNILSFS